MKKQILERMLAGHYPTMEESLMMMNPDFMPLTELIHTANAITKQHHG